MNIIITITIIIAIIIINIIIIMIIITINKTEDYDQVVVEVSLEESVCVDAGGFVALLAAAFGF